MNTDAAQASLVEFDTLVVLSAGGLDNTQPGAGPPAPTSGHVHAENRRAIKWREVYGADWQEPARLLGCYAVKHFGCWLAEGGFAPSEVFATFLDGGELMDTRLMLARQQSVSFAYRAMRLDGGPIFDRGIGVLGAVGWLNAERIRLIGYEHYSYISDICMRFNWFDNTGTNELFWATPTTPLEIMPASIGQRALAIRIGARALARRAAQGVAARAKTRG